jgi:hypothetical protein
MSNPKERAKRPQIKTRQPQKRTDSGIFAKLRQLPHPIEEILGLQSIEPDYPPPQPSTNPATELPGDLSTPLLISPPLELPRSMETEIVGEGLERSEEITVKIKDLPEIEDLPKIEAQTRPDNNPVTEQPSYSNPATDLPGKELARPKSNQATKLPGQSVAGLRSSKDPGYHVPNWLDDEIMPVLPLSEQAVLRRLYRLSYGFNRQMTDPVSTTRLAEKCNLSEAGVKLAVKSLEAKGYIKVHRDLSGNPMGGNRYEVLTGLLTNPVSNQPGKSLTGPESSHIKDHEDLKKRSDHQSEVMRIYKTETGNSWTKTDDKAYQQILNVPLEKIEATIQAVCERAKDQPRSLNYFVQEILAAGQGSRARPKGNKHALERVMAEVQKSYIGGGIEEYIDAVRRSCARQGVAFDIDLFNEINNDLI